MGSFSVTQGTQPRALWKPLEGWDGGCGREAQEERDIWVDICILTADSFCCTTETNTIL